MSRKGMKRLSRRIEELEKQRDEAMELVAKMRLYIEQDRAHMVDLLLVSKPVKRLLRAAEDRILNFGARHDT